MRHAPLPFDFSATSSEIAPLLIIIKLEEFDIPGAAVIATIMLLLAFVMLLVVNLIQTLARRRYGDR